jgi:hypothetical protein
VPGNVVRKVIKLLKNSKSPNHNEVTDCLNNCLDVFDGACIMIFKNIDNFANHAKMYTKYLNMNMQK